MPHPHQPDGCAVSGLLCRLFLAALICVCGLTEDFYSDLFRLFRFYFVFISFHSAGFIVVYFIQVPPGRMRRRFLL